MDLIKAQGVAEANQRGSQIVAEERAKVNAMTGDEVQSEFDKLRKPR